MEGKNGKPYPPDSLYSLVCGINRHVREELGKPAFNVFAQTEDFLKFQQGKHKMNTIILCGK